MMPDYTQIWRIWWWHGGKGNCNEYNQSVMVLCYLSTKMIGYIVT